jgi:hypothetical protein
MRAKKLRQRQQRRAQNMHVALDRLGGDMRQVEATATGLAGSSTRAAACSGFTAQLDEGRTAMQ